MKQILCVIDFSGSTIKVLDVAATIAAACGASLVVLYPYRLIDYNHPGDMASLRQRLELDARDKFETLKQSVPQMATLSCEFRPEIGFISDRISANARRSKTDMIIIGQEQADSTSDMRSFDLQRLIRNAQLPFVIVPNDVPMEATVTK